MFDLELSRCPICQTSRGLVRQMREVQGQHFIWYECPECASALLWLGGDRWVYQQVGRPDKRYLLKRPLTTVELEALSVATAPAPVAPAYSNTESSPADAPSEPEAMTPSPAPAAAAMATERPKGTPLSLVVAVAIIALLCIVAAVIIIVTQL